MSQKELYCPHCGKKMNKWQSPYESNWGGEFKYVCFFDECPYFVRGWAFMEEKYGKKASYRHSVDPDTGYESPIPVASLDHLKPGIVD